MCAAVRSPVAGPLTFVDGQLVIAPGGHSHVDLRPTKLCQYCGAVIIYYPGTHKPGCKVIVHRADGPQQGRLYILSEERIHSRGVAPEAVTALLAVWAGAGYVGRNPS